MKLNKISSVFNVNKFAKRNVAIFGATLTAMLAMPTFAAEAEAATETKEDIEVIEVTGMLGSMKAAAVLKRTDGRIVDAIVAEDIGKLPDNNIAEALSRITGVSVSTDFGVGEGVSIRGLSSNRVELNGRTTIGDSRDGISLADYPSSFLKTVEVVKSPTADMIEGALGGTVSMKTVRPLELEELTGAVSIDAEYADKTENVAPIFSGSIGNNWDLGSAGSFGASAMVAYQNREIRQDQFSSKTFPVEGDVNGEPGNTPSGNIIERTEHSIEQYVEERERTAVNLSLQWAPESGNGMVYLDVSGTNRDGNQSGTSVLGFGSAYSTTENSYQTANGLNNFNNLDQKAIPKTYSDFRETNSFSNALGAEWNLTESILLTGEVSIASSESERPDTEFTLRGTSQDVFEQTGNAEYYRLYDGAFYQAGNKLPAYTFTNSNPEDDVISDASQAMYDPRNLALRTFKAEQKNTNNDETAARIDLAFDEPFSGADWLTQIKTGVRVTSSTYEYESYKEELKDMYKKVYMVDDEGNTTDQQVSLYVSDYNEEFAGAWSALTHANSFDQIGHSGQNDLLTVANLGNLHNTQQVYSQLQTLLAGTNYATTGSLAENQEFSQGAYTKIEEDTAAFYASFYLDFDVVTAIIGGRYVTTDISSVTYEDDALRDDTADYADFLPSLNLTYNVADDTYVRFAAAKVMRRADYGDLTSSLDENNDYTSATSGNHALDPHRATQFDLSVEQYFGEGNMVSFAIFYKDVESFLSSELSCLPDERLPAQQNVTQYTNVCQLDQVGVEQSNMKYANASDYANDDEGIAAVGDLRDAGLTGMRLERASNGESGKVQGFEVGYQQHFNYLPGAWSGLGLSANYTYADSEQPNGNPLLDISKNTFNLQGFWEYQGFGLRLAYNYRDSYLDTENEKRVENIDSEGNIKTDDSTSVYGNNYRADRGQLDFSASWDINEHFTVVANATNLTGEASLYESELGGAWKYTEADRRYTVGVRAKF